MSEAKQSGDRGAGRELSDLEPRTIAIFGLALAAAVVVCLIVAAWLFGFFATQRAREDIPPSPLARVEPPTTPVLQTKAPTDLARLRAEE
ncbi:MAG TPA: hypothetical protein VN203_27790, partial [Candidatus Acidoferrum sp.]|nr:hypothetical protein [Candidatus Acidoferrum sp.]